MDINDLRSAFSVIMFVMLAGIYIWAWSKKRKTDFEQAANLPFSEPEQPTPLESSTEKKAEMIKHNSGENV